MPIPETRVVTETVELTAELLVDGAEPVDPVISPDGRLVAHRALSRYGVEHELVVYPRLRATTSPNAQHQIDLLRRTRAWFARWLGAPAETA